MTPQSVAFAGLRTTSDGAIQAVASQAFNATIKDVDGPPAGVDATSDGWIYMSAQLKPDAAGSTLMLNSAQLVSSTQNGSSFDVSKILDAARQKVVTDYKPQYDAVLHQANAKLTRDLGNGFRSQGKLHLGKCRKSAFAEG